MIREIEALRFRCLRYVRQDLDPFHVLVGPNASGKTTFLDVIAFLGDLVADGLQEAIERRTQNFYDFLWNREGESFELAVHFEIPDMLREKLEMPSFQLARYEVAIGAAEPDGELGIRKETLLLKEAQEPAARQAELFPCPPGPPQTISTPSGTRSKKFIVNKVPGGNDNFYDETGGGWDHAFKLGPRKCALGNLPEDETRFPVSTWVKGLLSEGIQRLVLDSRAMRRPSPPGQPRGFLPDGSNLPWVVERLTTHWPAKLREWIAHLQTALPDLEGVSTVLREEDRNRYLRLHYRGGLKVPCWGASDGTLRLLALTLPAYLPALEGIFLIEEPENGIHPRALETLYQSLSSVYGAQILMATHSPVLVAIADPSGLLCFAKTEEGATDIVRGTEHPQLEDWRRETNLGELFAAGVLG